MTDSPPPTPLTAPYGGPLVNLLAPDGERSDGEREELRARAALLPSAQLSDRAVCDLELLAAGGFSPLDRFLGKDDYARVLQEMRLADGRLWPMPITLPLDPSDVRLDGEIALRDAKNNLLAVMTVEEAYEWDRTEAAERICGTQDARHPLVAEMARWGSVNVSGSLRVIDLPLHYDFRDLRLTPAQCRARLEAMGAGNVVAFQTRNPLHRVHEELTKRAAAAANGVLLLHPVVGLTKPGDVDHYTRVRTYRALTERHYAPGSVLLSLLPLAMRMAGPREALWHALIRRNYGANHLIVGRDHAGPGADSSGKPFYGPYDAQEMVEAFKDETGVRAVPFQELVYLPDEDRYEEAGRIPPGAATASLSGTQARDDYLNKGVRLPAWFTRPEVAEVLAESYPPRHAQGVCVWFTGLSGSGKTTTAEALVALLMEEGRRVTVLDGDVVRTHLSKGLGFSKEDRDTNILRIGFVASEVVRAGGVAVCAAVSPYAAARAAVRGMMESDAGDGNFVEVYVNTPLEACEARDSKGMYAKARRGEITGFTGIDDPYEAPAAPELELETTASSPEENARLILGELRRRGFVRGGA